MKGTDLLNIEHNLLQVLAVRKRDLKGLVTSTLNIILTKWAKLYGLKVAFNIFYIVDSISSSMNYIMNSRMYNKRKVSSSKSSSLFLLYFST